MNSLGKAGDAISMPNDASKISVASGNLGGKRRGGWMVRKIAVTVVLMFAFAVLAQMNPQSAFGLTGGRADNTEIVAKPGQEVHFKITLNYTATEPLSSITYSLATKYLPEDWAVHIWYNGQDIRGLTIPNKQTPSLDLEIDVPETAEVGQYPFWFMAIGKELYTESIIVPLQVDVEALERKVKFTCDHQSVGLDSDGLARFTLTLSNVGETDEWLNLTGEASKDWKITFKDQVGRAIYEVYLPLSSSKTIQVEVTPPLDLVPGIYGFNVGAWSNDRVANSTLGLKVVILEAAEKPVSVLYPDLSEEAGKTITFPITLRNLGTNSIVYRISTLPLPSGWTSSFKTTPGGSTSVSSVTLGKGESVALYLEVIPPKAVEVGTYTIPIQVLSDSGATYLMNLKVTIVGSYGLKLEPSTLLTSVTSGEATTLTAKVTNTGHTPVTSISLNVEAPNGWDSSISPVRKELLEASESTTFTIVIKTPEDAVAGDYMVTLTGLSDQIESDSVQLRVTVTTPTSWGLLGVGVAVIMVIALLLVFMKFRRR